MDQATTVYSAKHLLERFADERWCRQMQTFFGPCEAKGAP
jgi:hypothetical protein